MPTPQEYGFTWHVPNKRADCIAKLCTPLDVHTHDVSLLLVLSRYCFYYNIIGSYSCQREPPGARHVCRVQRLLAWSEPSHRGLD